MCLSFFSPHLAVLLLCSLLAIIKIFVDAGLLKELNDHWRFNLNCKAKAVIHEGEPTISLKGPSIRKLFAQPEKIVNPEACGVEVDPDFWIAEVRVTIITEMVTAFASLMSGVRAVRFKESDESLIFITW